MLLAVPASAAAAAGDLDPSFGSGGLVTTDFGGRGDFDLAVALQPDGKIVAAGNSSALGVFSVSFALARYNSDGTPDASFGTGGTVLTSFGGRLSAASDVVVQPDGKVVAVGLADGDFGVARYNPDGTLDATFGTGGLVKTDFGGCDQGQAVALQPDGKIVAVGLVCGAIGVARYNPDGSLDTAFGSGGKVITDASSSFDGAFDVLVSGGKIVVGGGSGNYPFGDSDFQLVRYNPDGSLDGSFGNSGIVTTDFGGSDTAFGIALAAGGKVVATGATKGAEPSDVAVARYSADGSLDSSFGSGGTITTDISGASEDTSNGAVVHPAGSPAPEDKRRSSPCVTRRAAPSTPASAAAARQPRTSAIRSTTPGTSRHSPTARLSSPAEPPTSAGVSATSRWRASSAPRARSKSLSTSSPARPTMSSRCRRTVSSPSRS
jgi:uncharacterized delta-60 repeat protein